MKIKKYRFLEEVKLKHLALSGVLVLGGYVACGDESKPPKDPAEVVAPETPAKPIEDVVEEEPKPTGEEPEGNKTPSRPIKDRAEGFLGLAGIEMKEIVNENGFIVYGNKEENPNEILAFADLNQLSMDVITPEQGGLAQLSSFASHCRIAVNGGYFSSERQESVSLLVDDGSLIAEDAQGLGSKGYGHPSRGTILLGKDAPMITWATLGENGIEVFDFPRESDSNKAEILAGEAVTGNFSEALGAGPVLVMDSALVSSSKVEWLDGAIKPNFPNSRSAVGLMKNNVVAIYTIKQALPLKWGKSIKSMSNLFTNLGAVSALNLDGGGSTSFVLEGAGFPEKAAAKERAVASGLCIK